jgi:hypothetical protein
MESGNTNPHAKPLGTEPGLKVVDVTAADLVVVRWTNL